MNTNDYMGDISVQVTTRIKWIICALMDAVFLALWVAFQWFVDDQVITKLQLSGISMWVLQVSQVLFALATLAPIAIYIYVDIRIMLIQAQKRIKREKSGR
jgi:hypothetical protein